MRFRVDGDQDYEFELEDIQAFLYNNMGFCGCGDNESTIKLLQNVLSTIKRKYDSNSPETLKRNEDMENADKELNRFLQQEENPSFYYSYLYWLEQADLLEHGSSIRCAWLTNLGISVLKALNKYTVDQLFD